MGRLNVHFRNLVNLLFYRPEKETGRKREREKGREEGREGERNVSFNTEAPSSV